MIPIFMPMSDDDAAIWSMLGVIGLIVYLIYSAFTFAQHQIFNVKLNHQNACVEELAHQKWHGEYTVEEITVSDEDGNSYPNLPVCYDVNLVVWSKKVKGVQENGGYAFKGVFQTNEYQYYILKGEGLNPLYSPRWNKGLIQPPLIEKIRAEKSKEIYEVPIKKTHFAFSKGRIEEIKDVEDSQQSITAKEFTNNDNY
ncbi:hypothetical protein ABLU29_07600 [Lactococcus lactis]|uniref:hypothetical protein n=1 Tax=Lactococcus lactis TaxID=1358 RepID=UPI003878365C